MGSGPGHIEQRLQLEEQAVFAWRAVEQAMQTRQSMEQRVEAIKLKQRLLGASKAQLDELRATLQEQVAAATTKRDTLAAQLEARNTRRARRLAGALTEGEAGASADIVQRTFPYGRAAADDDDDDDHDDVILLALIEAMFKKYKALCAVVKYDDDLAMNARRTLQRLPSFRTS